MGISRKDLSELASAAGNLDSRLLEQLDSGFENAARSAQVALDSAPPNLPTADRFELALRAVLTFAAANPDLAHLCLAEAPGLGPTAVARRNAGLQRFVAMLERELDQNQTGPSRSLIAEMVVGGIYEVVQRTARTGNIVDLPDLTDGLRALWEPALSN